MGLTKFLMRKAGKQEQLVPDEWNTSLKEREEKARRSAYEKERLRLAKYQGRQLARPQQKKKSGFASTLESMGRFGGNLSLSASQVERNLFPEYAGLFGSTSRAPKRTSKKKSHKGKKKIVVYV